MPIGKYKNFDECVRDQISRGKSEEDAKRICGWMEHHLIKLEDFPTLQTDPLRARNIIEGQDTLIISPEKHNIGDLVYLVADSKVYGILKIRTIFGPEKIPGNVAEFLDYFMVRKVMCGKDLMRAAGTVMKKLAVLKEKLVPEPGIERLTCVISLLQEFREFVRAPFVFVRGSKQIQQAVDCRGFTPYWWDADNAVPVGKIKKLVTLLYQCPCFVGEFHFCIKLRRPAVAKQSSNSYLERIIALCRMSMENPLRRVVGVRLGQAVGIFLLSYFCPIVEVERDFDHCVCSDIEFLVYFSYFN